MNGTAPNSDHLICQCILRYQQDNIQNIYYNNKKSRWQQTWYNRPKPPVPTGLPISQSFLNKSRTVIPCASIVASLYALAFPLPLPSASVKYYINISISWILGGWVEISNFPKIQNISIRYIFAPDADVDILQSEFVTSSTYILCSMAKDFFLCRVRSWLVIQYLGKTSKTRFGFTNPW